MHLEGTSRRMQSPFLPPLTWSAHPWKRWSRPSRAGAAFLLLPRAVDRTEVVCSLLFAADAVADPAFDPSDAADLWHLVNQQDWAICESVQRGMSSRGYRQGWFAPMEDDSLDIRRWLLPLLERGRG